MSGNMLGMQTVSEVMQGELKRKSCPIMMECTKMVNKFTFTNICNTAFYTRCFEFSKRMGEIDMPSSWLRTLAIKKDSPPEVNENL